jgi:hypothetical protein
VRFKGTLALLAVFVALGGYVYFSDFYNNEERQKQEESKKKLFGGEAKDVVEITLEHEGKTTSAVRKGETDWEITSPVGLEADAEAWEQLASRFVEMRKDEIVTTEKSDLAAYGLNMPGIVIKAKLMNGQTPGVLIGSENPRKTFNYAKRADSDEVFLISTADSSSFKKSLTDLRNKKVLDFEADNIDAVRISSSGKNIEIQKVGMDWQIKKPLEARADNGEVMSFLSAIQFSRTSAFADDKVDARSSGIETPAVRVTLHDQKAGVDRTLVFGKSPEKGKYYAKDASRPAIFILATEIIDKAQGPLFTWRDKSIAHFGADGTSAVDEFDIVRGSERLSMMKTGSDWVASDGPKLQQPKISEMLSAIQNERATSIIDAPRVTGAYGLDKPRLEVALREKGKEVVALRFGGDSQNPAGVYLKSADPTILTVSKDLYDRLNVKWSDILEGPPASSAPPK